MMERLVGEPVELTCKTIGRLIVAQIIETCTPEFRAIARIRKKVSLNRSRFYIMAGFAAILWFRGEVAEALARQVAKANPHLRDSPPKAQAESTRRNTDRGKEPAKPTFL
jgi:hypothetical protein